MDQDQSRGARPTLFIGLGGSGCKTVTKLRKLITKSTGNNKFKQIVEFLKIDACNPPDIGVEVSHEDYAALSTPNSGTHMVSVLANHMGEEIQNQFPLWWRKGDGGGFHSQNVTFKAGAGQIRECGRLLFAFHEGSSNINQSVKIKGRLNAIKASFDGKKQALANAFDQDPGTFGEQIDIIIIAGLGGGTGSAIALDIGILARSVFPNARGVVLYGFLDNVLSLTDVKRSDIQKNMHQNVLHALAEVEYWQRPDRTSRQPYSIYWNSDQPTPTTFDHNEGPFDAVYLIGAEMPGGARFARSETYYESVAEFFARFYGQDASAAFMSENINHALSIITPYEENNRTVSIRYGRIGVHHVAFPVLKVSEFLIQKTIREALEAGFQHRHSEQRTAVMDGGKQKRDNKGLRVWKGVIEQEVSKTLAETGLDCWSEEVLIQASPEGGKKAVQMEKPPKLNENDILQAGSHAQFVKVINQKSESIKKFFGAVDGRVKAAEKEKVFDDAVKTRLESFCAWQSRGRISVRNMRFYLDELQAAISNAFEHAQNDARRWLSDITTLTQPGVVCSGEWLKGQENLFSGWNKLKSKEKKGRGAKDAALSHLKSMSQGKYAYAASAARTDWLQRCLSVLELWSSTLKEVESLHSELQKQCEEKMERAKDGLRNRPGVQTNVIDSEAMLMEFNPEWFPDYANNPDAKRELYEVYQRGISGQLNDLPGLRDNGMGLWSRLENIRDQKSTNSGETSEREVKQEVENWKKELIGIMTDVARLQWKDRVESVSIWDVLLWKIRKGESIDVSSEDGIDHFRSKLMQIVRNYQASMRTFGKTTTAADALDPEPIKSFTIVYSHENAAKVLTSAFSVKKNDLFNPSNFLERLWTGWKVIDQSQTHEIVLLVSEQAYPARVFKGLEELPSYFEDPAGRSQIYSWNDIRYPEWITQLGGAPPAADWALACFAWCQGSKIGLEQTRKYAFSFNGEEFEGIYGLIDKLPVHPVWKQLKEKMQEYWGEIAPAKRTDEFKAAIKFVAGKRKGMRNTIDEPKRLDCLKEAERLLREEAKIAEDASKNPAVCQEVASFFIEAARAINSKDPRSK